MKRVIVVLFCASLGIGLCAAVPHQVLPFGALLTPQFAQEAAKDSEISDQQSSVRGLMAAFIRTINTAEASYHAEQGSYGSWQALLGNQEYQKYLNGWLAQVYPQFYPHAAQVQFTSLPEVLPGLNMRLNVAPDGQSYIVFAEDAADKTGFAFLSDERGIIRECKFSQ
jgi:hypothetical protein